MQTSSLSPATTAASPDSAIRSTDQSSSSVSPPEKIIRLLVVGDDNSGRGSLIRRFVDDKFNPQYNPTHCNPYIKDITLKNRIVKIEIWHDTRTDSCHNTNFRDKDGVLFVFDRTDQESYNNIKYWMQTLDRYHYPNIKKILVGTKTDLDAKLIVDPFAAEEFARNVNCEYFSVSAKNGTNVQKVFERIATLVDDNISQEPEPIRAGPQRPPPLEQVTEERVINWTKYSKMVIATLAGLSGLVTLAAARILFTSEVRAVIGVSAPLLAIALLLTSIGAFTLMGKTIKSIIIP